MTTNIIDKDGNSIDASTATVLLEQAEEGGAAARAWRGALRHVDVGQQPC